MRDTARIAIGSRLLRDGEMCEVIALEAAEAVVIDRHGRSSRVRVADLLRQAGQAGPGLAGAAGGQAPAGELAGVLLGAAGEDALAEARSVRAMSARCCPVTGRGRRNWQRRASRGRSTRRASR